MAQQTGNLNCAKERLKALLATSSPKEGWDILWKEQITPWDAKAFGSAPALVALAQEEGALPLGKALVPGCGSGSDLVTLAKEGRRVIGLELSPTAAARAKQTLEENKIPDELATVAVGDFFELHNDASVVGDKKFNLIYDYTFLCAMPPELRPAWAQQMHRLLEPNGVLVCLMFPLNSDHTGGPPYAVTTQLYRDLLDPLGFKSTRFHEVEASLPGREGKEWIGLFVKQ